jgi:uncharacterized protein (DUF58 family)
VKKLRQALIKKSRQRAADWVRRRQGADSASVLLHSQRIYILPTRVGLIFAVIVFTMLLGAMNYNNNMGFALTFLLTGISIISIYHCHRNLTDICFHYHGAQPVFAGDDLQLQFVLENKSTRPRWQIRVTCNGAATLCDLLDDRSRAALMLRQKAETRGPFHVPRIQLSTQFPLGLFRAWAWINLDHKELVYPKPALALNQPLTGSGGKPSSGFDAVGDDDFSGFRDFQHGDSPKHIAWKALARTGDKLVMEYRTGAQEMIWINWSDLPGLTDEERLSRLTRLVVDTENAGHKYGLRIPGIQIEPGNGTAHRHTCLKELAVFGLTEVIRPESADSASDNRVSQPEAIA